MVAVILVAFALAGCGSKANSGTSAGSGGAGSNGTAVGTVKNTKAKFVLHAGLAFGAFHHFIYGPFRAGDFSHPFLHKLTLIKAGLAAAFVVHEVKLAYTDANADPTLSKLTGPLNQLESKVTGLVSQVKSGHVSSTQLGSAQGAIGSLGSLASGAGASITDVIPHL